MKSMQKCRTLEFRTSGIYSDPQFGRPPRFGGRRQWAQSLDIPASSTPNIPQSTAWYIPAGSTPNIPQCTASIAPASSTPNIPQLTTSYMIGGWGPQAPIPHGMVPLAGPPAWPQPSQGRAPARHSPATAWPQPHHQRPSLGASCGSLGASMAP